MEPKVPTIPATLPVGKFAAARINEIKLLTQALQSNENRVATVSQRLPRHMRRRVMSHAVKRLPRRLRSAFINQMKKCGETTTKKQLSRKTKRRKRLFTFSGKSRWLELHLWHAKRFHMIDQWGYKLPYKRCDKNFRALYRASVSHCLLQDYSYYSCLEISGSYTDIVERLSHITTPQIGFTPKARCYADGKRHGTITFYHPDEYPMGAIGTVNFHWFQANPNTNSNISTCNSNNSYSTIWLWLHPSFCAEFVHVISTLFDVPTLTSDVNVNVNDVVNNEVNYSASNDKFQVKYLHEDFSRFRLTGPLSIAVLKKSLVPAHASHESLPKLTTNNEIFQEQNSFWNILNVHAPCELPNNCVIALNVIDPRYALPTKRTKAINPERLAIRTPIEQISTGISYTLLNDELFRKECVANKLTDYEFGRENSKKIVPGMSDNLTNFSNSTHKIGICPVLLLQRPGNTNQQDLGYGSGIDVILPRKWSRSLWITLIMWGARVGGLVEDRVATLECLAGDVLQPDTHACKTQAELVEAKKRTEYFARPPKTRVNYVKLGVANPFKCEWDTLMREWISKESKDLENIGYYVLRDRKILIAISDFFNHSNRNAISSMSLTTPALIPVKFVLCAGALITDNAMICLPKFSDLNEPIVEPNHVDSCAKKRKVLRCAHKKRLLNMRRKRQRIRREIIETRLQIEREPTTEKKLLIHAKLQALNKRLLSYSLKISIKSEMEELWLPRATSVRDYASRVTIGFVTHGDYSFRRGKSAAVGYIALSSLVELTSNKILLRNVTSQFYHFARMDVILS